MSHLLTFKLQRAPRGVQRVQAAYVDHFLNCSGTVRFITSRGGELVMVPTSLVRGIAQAYRTLWNAGGARTLPGLWILLMTFVTWCCVLYSRSLFRRKEQTRASVYLSVGVHNLGDTEALARVKSAAVKLIFFVHDLDPIDQPGLFPSGRAELCARRMTNVANFADMVIAPSATTARNFRSFARNCDGAPPVFVRPLASDLRESGSPLDRKSSPQSYFVCIGTIEPRKNQDLLLRVWQELARDCAGNAPRLFLIGKSGWNKNFTEAIASQSREIGAGLISHIRELGDADLLKLLQNACALLMPTRAEGFGIPLIEALNCGVPAIVSNLAVLREVGGAIPDFLDPGDAAAWKTCILEYCDPNATRRIAQLARLSAWQPAAWDNHFRLVDQLVASCAGHLQPTSDAILHDGRWPVPKIRG